MFRPLRLVCWLLGFVVYLVFFLRHFPSNFRHSVIGGRPLLFVSWTSPFPFFFFFFTCQVSALLISGNVQHWMLPYGVPAALLCEAILHANNMRDIEQDSSAGISTLATVTAPHSHSNWNLVCYRSNIVLNMPLIMVFYMVLKKLWFSAYCST